MHIVAPYCGVAWQRAAREAARGGVGAEAPGGVGAEAPGGVEEGLQHARVHGVVGVDEGYVVARGDVEAEVAGGCLAGIGAVEHAHSGVRGGCGIGDGGGAVGAAVVYHDELQGSVGLREHAVEALSQVALAVIDGYYDRHLLHRQRTGLEGADSLLARSSAVTTYQPGAAASCSRRGVTATMAVASLRSMASGRSKR